MCEMLARGIASEWQRGKKHTSAGTVFRLQGRPDTCSRREGRKGWVGRASGCSSKEVPARPMGCPQRKLPIRGLPHWWPGTRTPAVLSHRLSPGGSLWSRPTGGRCNERASGVPTSHAPAPRKPKRMPPRTPHKGRGEQKRALTCST